MVTVQSLIESSYARSSANDPGKLSSDAELLGFANRLYQALFAIAAAATPESYLSRATVTLAAGVGTLPLDVIDLRLALTSAGLPVNVIPVEEIYRSWHLPPAVFRQGRSIVSRGNPGDPGPSDSLSFFLLDAPATLSALDSSIDVRFPVRYHELIVLELALYLSTKDEGRDPAEFAELEKARNAHFEAFLRLSGLTLTALQSPHGAAILARLEAFLAK